MEIVHRKKFIPFKECIKNYKVIGWGSCSDVIVSNEIGDKYAIKRIMKSSLNSKKIDYFFNEVRCLERISCSSIVSMNYIFQTELTYNLVLDRGDIDLYCFSERFEYSTNIIDKITKDLCKAIEYIHNINIYHRDIKPENVIVFYDNASNHSYKLCDFGLAVIDNDIGRGIVGSPGFYSPEMSSNTDYSRKYADYWSLGCLILEQIIGNNIFTSEWLCGCYKKTSGLELANACNNFLKTCNTKMTKKQMTSIKCLLNSIPNKRILPNVNKREKSSSLECLIDFLERKKLLSKKYEKIHPIEDFDISLV